jgi:hypothetical protein
MTWGRWTVVALVAIVLGPEVWAGLRDLGARLRTLRRRGARR